MRKLLTDFNTAAVGMPIKSGTILHLQTAFKEINDAIIRAFMLSASGGAAFDPTVPYVLWGCIIDESDPVNTTISAGAIYFNNEVFLFDDAVVNIEDGASAPQYPVPILDTTFEAVKADPAKFTDGNNHNIHAIRKILWSDYLGNFPDAMFNPGLLVFFESPFIHFGWIEGLVSTGAVWGTPETVNFGANEYRKLSGTRVGANTLNFNITGASHVGAKVRIEALFSTAATMNFTISGGGNVKIDFKDAGINLAALPGAVIAIEAEYTGGNALGHPEVRVKLYLPV